MSDEKLPKEELQTPNTEENSKEIPTTETLVETKVDAENKVEGTETVANIPENNSEENKTEETSEAETTVKEEVEATQLSEIISEANPEDSNTEESANEASTTTHKEEASAEDQDSEDEDEEEEVASSEDDEEEENEETEQKDYSTLSKKELIAELDKLLKTKKIQELKHDVEEIRSEFNNQFNEELEQKKEEFLAEGGNIIDFHYTTPLRKEFNTLYFDYKEKRNGHYKNLKKDLQANMDKRWELIEELKSLLSAEENINTTYKHFKDIQEKWHVAGAIPRDKYNTVWNTYHHHVENFYDFLHLNREFRDLDFKHNLDAKLKLITRAEELGQEENVNKAFRELQMLHKMWKEEIGPVAQEYRDEVWDKFSDATKIIHDKRQEQLAEMEKDFETNYEKKKQLVEELIKTTEEAKPSHQGWQNAIKKCKNFGMLFSILGVFQEITTKKFGSYLRTQLEISTTKKQFL